MILFPLEQQLYQLNEKREPEGSRNSFQAWIVANQPLPFHGTR